jgi:hypothetical protein
MNKILDILGRSVNGPAVATGLLALYGVALVTQEVVGITII